MKIDFNELVGNILSTDSGFRNHAVKSVDKLMTLRNWLIGAYIFEYEQNGADKAEYGSKLEENIAVKIDRKGLSARNLKLFKQFYITYPQIMQTVSALSEISPETVQTVSALLPRRDQEEIKYPVLPDILIENLSFSHFVELLKINDKNKRLFYEIQAIKGAWSVRELKNQINKLCYERTANAQNTDFVLNSLVEKTETQKPKAIIKTPYVFDFLEIPDGILASESELEKALISDLKNFMIELGHGFCFEAQQKRIVIGGEYYFIDLVFYHRILKCHILIELKIDEFKHTYAGQLNTYLQYYKQNLKEENDNPPIGILLCTNQNSELVEYALGGMDNNLFVSQYQTKLPSEKQLQKFLLDKKKDIEALGYGE